MKTRNKLFGLIAIAIIATGIIGCKNDEPTPQPVTREFTDLTFLEKSIKLIDETGNAQDLKARGIWKQIQDGFNAATVNPASEWAIKFNKIYATGNFSIVIKQGGTDNDWAKADGYNVIIHENHLSEDAEYIRDYIFDAVSDNMTI